MESTENTEPRLSRKSIAVKASIAGAFSGLVAVGFTLGLQWAEKFRSAFFQLLSGYNLIMPSLVFACLLGLVIYTLLRWAPEASGSGIPHIKGVLGHGFSLRPFRVIIVKFFGGIISIGSGLALGREGPTVQMGASVAQIFSQLFGSSEKERKLLIAACAGSGLAAAFNAPFAGLIFILEELHQQLDRISLTAAFCANISANLVCRLCLGQAPVYTLENLNYPHMKLILWCVVFGIAVGLIGWLFNVCLLKSLPAFKNIKMFLGICLGLAFGAACHYCPEILGSGGTIIGQAFSDHIPLQLLFIYLAARFVLTILSYNTGAPGGIFAPILLLGSVVGAIFFHFVDYVSPGAFSITIFVVMGMCGIFSAVVRGPVTGIILIMEMTGQFVLLLPLMVVAICAYAVPEFFGNKPVYDALLDYDLEQKAKSVKSSI